MCVRTEGKYGFKRCAFCLYLFSIGIFFAFDLGKMFFSCFVVVPVIAQVQLGVQKQLNKTISMVCNTRNISNAGISYMLYSPWIFSFFCQITELSTPVVDKEGCLNVQVT